MPDAPTIVAGAVSPARAALEARTAALEGELRSLRAQPQTEEARDRVQEELAALVGVGRKVADCVALFSLDRADCE